MNQENENLTNAFKVINIIYLSLGAGMLLTISAFYLIILNNGVSTDPELSKPFMFVAPFIAVSGFAAGRYMYSFLSNKSKEKTDVNEKLANYRVASLIVWATLELPAIFSGVAFFLSGNQMFLAFFALIFLVFIYQKPSIGKFQQDF